MNDILDAYMSTLRHDRDMKPLNLVVITDGEASDNWLLVRSYPDLHHLQCCRSYPDFRSDKRPHSIAAADYSRSACRACTCFCVNVRICVLQAAKWLLSIAAVLQSRQLCLSPLICWGAQTRNAVLVL